MLEVSKWKEGGCGRGLWTSSHCSAVRMPAHRACTPSLESACWRRRWLTALSSWSRPWGRRAPGSLRKSAELGGGQAHSAGTASSATRGWSPCLAGDSVGELTAHGCAQWGCLGHAESLPPEEKRFHRSVNDVNHGVVGYIVFAQFLHVHTCESLSLPQPEPMMKATSCPSSNQPSDSSGHWPRKLSTSSRVSGHSPDTETNAGGGAKRGSSYSGSCPGSSDDEYKKKMQHERNVFSFKLMRWS